MIDRTGTRAIPATELAARFVERFFQADRALTWLSAETELSMELMPSVRLAGVVDAIGDDWFGEWKTMNPRGRDGWREKWRFHPQTLTYGLLLRATRPMIKRFTVRVAFKGNPPTFDYEWFSYSDKELDCWRGELIAIGQEIRYQQSLETVHWPLNHLSCYAYGPKYPCPFLHNCAHQDWGPVAGMIKRESHLKIETLAAPDSNSLILNATRIITFLECPEKHRRMYIENMVPPKSEALVYGSEFHSLVGAYYTQMIGEKDGRAAKQ
jgi:hypothetical protein